MIRIGSFQLVDVLGEGGVGQVWLGEHPEHPRPVAIKLLSARKQDDPRYREAMLNELRAMARLEHPAVVRLIAAGVATADDERIEGLFSQGTPFLVMDYAEGGSLVSLIHQLAWPQIEALLYLALHALAHAHARGVVHRDIKPENFLVGWPGERIPVRITDFGLSVVRDTPDSTLGWGTPNYMAPEQVDRRMFDQGPWTDVFSLGCMAFELASHTKAMDRDDEGRRFARPFAPVVDVPDGLAEWLASALTWTPRLRPLDARQAAWALAKHTGRDRPMALEEAGDLLSDWLDDQDVSELAPHSSPFTPSPGTPDGTTMEPDRAVSSMLRGADAVPNVPEDVWPISWREHTAPKPLLAFGADTLVTHRLPPLIGHEAERDALWQALSDVRAEAMPHTVHVEAEAGYGKTHLLDWLAMRVTELGAAHVMRVRCDPTREADEGLLAALKQMLGLAGEREHEPGFAHLPTSWRPEVGDDADAMSRLFAQHRWARSSEPSHLERYGAIARQLARLGKHRPLIVCIDDAHFAAEELFFIRYAMRREAEESRVMFVLATTPHELESRQLERVLLDELHSMPRVVHLPLEPLDDMSVAEILTSRLPISEALATALARRANSMPSFAVQLMGDLITRRLLARRREGDATVFDLIAESTDVRLPGDELELWTERLSTYRAGRPDEWPALAVAGILGRTLRVHEWFRGCDVLGVWRDASLLDHWQRMGVLRREDDHEIQFVSEHVHTALLDLVRTDDGWEDTHANLVRLIPVHEHERRADFHVHGGAVREAIAELVASAEARVGRGELLRTHRLLDRLDDLLEDTPSTLGGAWSAMLRAQCYDLQGMYVEALETGTRALNQAREGGAIVLAERADALCAFALLHRGSTLAASERFEHLAESARDPEASLTAHVGLGRVAQRRGELDLSRWLFLEGLDKARDLDVRYLEGMCLNGLGDLARQEGDLDDAATYSGDALEVFEHLGHRVMVADCLNDLAELARLRGEYARAMELCQRSIATFESAESRLSNRARLEMAYVSLGLEEFQRAHVLLERLSISFHDAGDYGQLAMAVVGTLPILARLGSTQRLIRSLEHAKKLLEITDRRDRDVAYALQMVRTLTQERVDIPHDPAVDLLVEEILERHAPRQMTA